MKTALIILAAFTVATASQAAYKFKIGLERPGLELIKTEVQIQDGETKTLDFDGGTRVEVLPQSIEDRVVGVQVRVLQMENGKYVLKSKPKVVSKLNHLSSVSELNADGTQAYKVSLLPTMAPTKLSE